MATLSQLKDALAALGVSTATGNLRGEARRDELSKRLQHARVASGADLNEHDDECPLGNGESDLHKLSLSELRSALELKDISTQTPGLKGDARRHALIQRLMNSYSRKQQVNEDGSSCVYSTSSRVSDDGIDDTKSETSSSAYSTATDFFFYDAAKSGDPELQLKSKSLMPQLSFTNRKSESDEEKTFETLQRKLFELRTKLHSARKEQQDDIQRVLQKAGIEISLSTISTQLQILERERRRLEDNYFGHELVTSDVLSSDTPGTTNQVSLEFIQEDALLLIGKHQQALKQLAERTKEAMAVVKCHALQVESARTESTRQEEEGVLKQIQQIESSLRAGKQQGTLLASPPSFYHQPLSDLTTPILTRWRSMPSGLQHDQWEQMDSTERRELQFELRTAASFHIRRGRVPLSVSESLAVSSSSNRTPSQADKLGMKARFMEKAKRGPREIALIYQKALQLDNRHAENLGSYALFLCSTCSQVENAQDFFEKALSVDPDNAKNLANYANFLKNERRDFTKSEALYKRALKSAPRDANVLGGYADLLVTRSSSSRDDLLLARRVLKKALSLSPSHVQNQLRLALVLVDLKEGEPAQRCFKQLIFAMEQQIAGTSGEEIRPGSKTRKNHETLACIYEKYANFLCRCGQLHRAKQLYGKALALDPERPSLLRNFSYFLRENKAFLSPRSDSSSHERDGKM